MNLAIDIGNTSVKSALFAGPTMREAHVQLAELDDLLKKNKIERAIISSSGEKPEVEEALRQYRIPYLVLNRQTRLPIAIGYQTPETLGPDRIAGSVGAQALFAGQPVLKIDFGTCITYDFLCGFT